MNRRLLRTFLLTAAVVTVIGIEVACSNQGEGEVCDNLNGSDDCTGGLVCYPAIQLTNTTSDRCCPVDPTLSTHPVCKGDINNLADANAPPNTGPDTGTGTVDSGSSDASNDADAATDADAQ